MDLEPTGAEPGGPRRLKVVECLVARPGWIWDELGLSSVCSGGAAATRGCGMVWEPSVSPCVDQVGRNRSCHAQGEPPQPPASPKGAVEVLEVLKVPVPTGGSCWKTLEIPGMGTAEELPQQGDTQGCTNTLGSAAGKEEENEEERNPPGPGDLLYQPGLSIPPGRTPLAWSRKVRSTLGWQSAGSACSTLHEKMLVATETRHFPGPFWAICVLGRREGLPVTYQLHGTRCLSPPRREHQGPEEATKTWLLPAEGLRGFAGCGWIQELSTGWDLLLRRSSRSGDPRLWGWERPGRAGRSLQLEYRCCGGILSLFFSPLAQLLLF